MDASKAQKLFSKLKNSQSTLQDYFDLCLEEAKTTKFQSYRSKKDRAFFLNPKLNTSIKNRPDLLFEHVSECVCSIFQANDNEDKQMLEIECEELIESLESAVVFCDNPSPNRNYEDIYRHYQNATDIIMKDPSWLKFVRDAVQIQYLNDQKQVRENQKGTYQNNSGITLQEFYQTQQENLQEFMEIINQCGKNQQKLENIGIERERKRNYEAENATIIYMLQLWKKKNKK